MYAWHEQFYCINFSKFWLLSVLIVCWNISELLKKSEFFAQIVYHVCTMANGKGKSKQLWVSFHTLLNGVSTEQSFKWMKKNFVLYNLGQSPPSMSPNLNSCGIRQKFPFYNSLIIFFGWVSSILGFLLGNFFLGSCVWIVEKW